MVIMMHPEVILLLPNASDAERQILRERISMSRQDAIEVEKSGETLHMDSVLNKTEIVIMENDTANYSGDRLGSSSHNMSNYNVADLIAEAAGFNNALLNATIDKNATNLHTANKTSENGDADHHTGSDNTIDYPGIDNLEQFHGVEDTNTQSESHTLDSDHGSLAHSDEKSVENNYVEHNSPSIDENTSNENSEQTHDNTQENGFNSETSMSSDQEHTSVTTHDNAVDQAGSIDTHFIGNNSSNSTPSYEQVSCIKPSRNLINSDTKHFVVVGNYRTDVCWLQEAIPDIPIAVYTHDDPTAEYYVPGNVGDEAPCYLQYIIENYDNLPERTAFIHPHQYPWHSRPSMSSILQHLNWEFRDYFSLNTVSLWYAVAEGHHDIYGGATLDDDFHRFHGQEIGGKIRQFWEMLLLDELGPVPEYIRSRCCAQFVVHRDRIRLRSRQLYQNIYDLFQSFEQVEWNKRAEWGVQLELLWAIILGEPTWLNESDDFTFCQNYHDPNYSCTQEELDTENPPPYKLLRSRYF